MQRFKILERLFGKHNLERTDEMDPSEIEDLSIQRKELLGKMGWDKMTTEELRRIG
ncbi:hypothetical protein IH779_01450 [Patescibacteria group bacterium]|nr:hypothetical protein [Patescibacteria group bacterium]